CVSRPIPESGLSMLVDRGFHVTVRRDELPPSEGELVQMASEFPILVTLLSDPVTERVISAGVRMIAQMSAGYDNIDLAAATKHGVLVTNTPGVLTDAVAELTWALILAVARHIVVADSYTRRGCFKAWGPTLFLGTELYGKTIGILGAGRIGTRVGEIAHAFSMRILYFDRMPSERLNSLGGRQVDLQTLLQEADIVSLHLPLNYETRGLMGADEIRLMKPTAILVNTARGPILDESALASALREGRLAGAGLDVYEKEPQVHPDLLCLENVVLLPHIGSATCEARQAMSRVIAENIIAFAAGHKPPNALNPEVI
ncbi:MAG: 2-hydroxyacid dehydrogenase, partial [Candidatus Hydrothermia bacterium]